ncbi:hypothetical protein CHS0354_006294 [Potamilus streckersoni]|uniref:ornithine decarboxylase n=1 Tax=Potamilus streckersoni TaxID=2493646 RepID=A0AAE0S563_9BIVA|nr:hypothetical protein CHS0354_006294 [Potamilus streckersoni]
MKICIGNNCVVDLLPFEKTRKTLVEEKMALHEKKGKEEAFMLGDLGDIISKYKRWVKKLPRVELFYAVKCNDDHAVLKVLTDLGASFDCASKSELRKILKLGVPPSRIIYANPCKQTSFIRYAAKHHVSLMTFDNEFELHKVKKNYPGAKLVFRMLPPRNFKVECDLGTKFGCEPSKARQLLEAAQNLGLDVVGVSFHVGSGCLEARAFAVAIQQARQVFDTGLDLGFNMNLLDIGGGFPGFVSPLVSFDEIAEIVNEALELHFPLLESVRIIGEPGRYVVTSAFTLVANIIAKRVVVNDHCGEKGETATLSSSSDEPTMMYYINDGVYGSFNSRINDRDHDHIEVLVPRDQETSLKYECSLWGPTCDSQDCIKEKIHLPELNIGDWLYFPFMGSYTTVLASSFNGMPRPIHYYYCLADVWHEVYPKEQRKKQACIKQIPQHIKSGHTLQEVTAINDLENLLTTSIPHVYISL